MSTTSTSSFAFRPTISLGLACLPLITMLVLFLVGSTWFTLTSELLVMVIVGSAMVATGVAHQAGATWDQVQQSAGEKLAAALPALLILLSIGILISTWLLSGTIPALIYYGLDFIDRRYLVLAAFGATSVMSICTGTSWGSAGTIGVALLGMAAAVGAPLDVTAGAIVSGAYFGDKLSPLSDSTNICALGAGAPLYSHIRNLMYTSIPSYLAAGVVYAVVSPAVVAPESAATGAVQLQHDLQSLYHLSWMTCIPVVIVLVGMLLRWPPVVGITASSLMAACQGVWMQGFHWSTVLESCVTGFRIGNFADQGVDPTTLSTDIAKLVERGGLYSLSNTLILIVAAFLLAGAMDASGAMQRLVTSLLSLVRSTFGLIAATMLAGTTVVALTSNNSVTALVVGELFRSAYDDRKLARENLGRSIEDSATIVEPLLPWTVSAAYMAGTLGVATLDYAPWAVFCYGGPLLSLFYAITFDHTGFGMKRCQVPFVP